MGLFPSQIAFGLYSNFRYPSYIYCMKLLYGNVAEVLVEETLHHGQILHDQLVNKAITRLTGNVKGGLLVR